MRTGPDFDRVRQAVRYEEPDRVPLVEVLVECPVMGRYLGREVVPQDTAGQVEFFRRAGYDYVPVVAGMMAPGKVTEDSAISRALRQSLRSRDSSADWNLEYSSFIRDRGDFESFPWDLAAEVDLSPVEAAGAAIPAGMKVVLVSGKIYTLSSMLMGFENFAVSLLVDEQLAADVLGRVAEIQMRVVERLVGLPEVGAVWAVDDIACNTGTMLSPQALRDHLFPYYRQIAVRCHAAGKLFLYHSDGNILPVLDDLVDLGVDAIHPVDPTVLDIARVKELAAGRIALFGNVSTELLRSGTPDDVRAEVKRLIAQVAPGGGYCIGSGNSVPAWARFENYTAMLDAAAEYGTYPIGV